MAYLIKPCIKIHGVIKNIPGDKSISHRAIIISSIAKGSTLIKNFSFSKDCMATLDALKSLGVRIKKKGRDSLIVCGRGISGLRKSKGKINLGESGTSMRVLMGLLCGQNFNTTLDAAESLRKRPMLRVIKPLRLMGARIHSRVKSNDGFPPINIYPSRLKAISWDMPIPSAQVKSAILLAGLYAKGQTKIYEPVKSRDHTERMLKLFGAHIKIKGKNIFIKPSDLLSPKEIYIPSDISSASFFMVLGCLLKGSRIEIDNVSMNSSRHGIVEALKKMGADIKVIYKKKRYFEPMAKVVIKSSKLKGITIKEEAVPSLIDELPILMVAASLAKGKSIFKGVGELRVKETDRIKSMSINLSRMGVNIKTKINPVREIPLSLLKFSNGVKGDKEDVVIEGRESLKGANLKSFGDHRTAMSNIVAALCAESLSIVDDIKCIDKSFPDFLMILKSILRY